MSYGRIFDPRAIPIAMFLTLSTVFSNHALQAKDPPADACAMLPAAQLAKVLEQPFGSPTQAKAPAAFRGSPTGTDCTYQAEERDSRASSSSESMWSAHLPLPKRPSIN